LLQQPLNFTLFIYGKTFDHLDHISKSHRLQDLIVLIQPILHAACFLGLQVIPSMALTDFIPSHLLSQIQILMHLAFATYSWHPPYPALRLRVGFQESLLGLPLSMSWLAWRSCLTQVLVSLSPRRLTFPCAPRYGVQSQVYFVQHSSPDPGYAHSEYKREFSHSKTSWRPSRS
jgi:hypothetical protein